jgi:hypothetical protein
MGDFIHSVGMTKKEIIEARTVDSGKTINSVSINQVTGDFIVTNPLNNQITVYPQSPNNPQYTLLGQTKTIKSFSGYGFLNYPLDARFDCARDKIWVADTGNNRALKINSYNYLVNFSISGLSMPHSIIPNLNNGGVFIKGFTNSTTGVVYYYSLSGVSQFLFTYPDTLSGNFQVGEAIFPLASTMAFDHTRSRLWWVAKEYVYMADVLNSQIISFDLSDYNYDLTSGIDIHVESGNAFVTCRNVNLRWYTVQIFRDNNTYISSAYLPKQLV